MKQPFKIKVDLNSRLNAQRMKNRSSYYLISVLLPVFVK